jgi:hypothetical protein
MSFKRFLRRSRRRVGKIAKGVGKGVRAVSGAVRKIDDAMKSPIGQVVLLGLKANPKTAGVATKLETGISQGREITDIAEGLTRGEQQAVEQAIERANRGMMSQ